MVVCLEKNVSMFAAACVLKLKSCKAANVVDDVDREVESEGAQVERVVGALDEN